MNPLAGQRASIKVLKKGTAESVFGRREGMSDLTDDQKERLRMARRVQMMLKSIADDWLRGIREDSGIASSGCTPTARNDCILNCLEK